MKSSNLLEDAVGPAVDILKKLFTNRDGEISDVDVSTARIAASLVSAWTRLKQTESAQEAVYFSMARDLASNPEQLAEYIRFSMPDVPLVKVLEKKEPALKIGDA